MRITSFGEIWRCLWVGVQIVACYSTPTTPPPTTSPCCIKSVRVIDVILHYVCTLPRRLHSCIVGWSPITRRSFPRGNGSRGKDQRVIGPQPSRDQRGLVFSWNCVDKHVLYSHLLIVSQCQMCISSCCLFCWVVMDKARFPLPELTARVDGWPVSITRQHGLSWRAVNTARQLG